MTCGTRRRRRACPRTSAPPPAIGARAPLRATTACPCHSRLPLLPRLPLASNPDTRYEGRFVRGQLRGRGSVKYAGGDSYTGELVGLARHGEGECSAGGGASRYVGQWAEDQHEGTGKLTSRLGEEYEGEWREGRPHGHGRRKSAERVEEEGRFEKGGLHGEGRRRDALGNSWRGVFVSGVLQAISRRSRADLAPISP
jgi:hypothetical protein